jgi:hypothetical protein
VADALIDSGAELCIIILIRSVEITNGSGEKISEEDKWTAERNNAGLVEGRSP